MKNNTSVIKAVLPSYHLHHGGDPKLTWVHHVKHFFHSPHLDNRDPPTAGKGESIVLDNLKRILKCSFPVKDMAKYNPQY